MKTINSGIIGCGFMGHSHIENLRRIPNVKIKAVSDISEEKSKELARYYNIPTSKKTSCSSRRLSGRKKWSNWFSHRISCLCASRWIHKSN